MYKVKLFDLVSSMSEVLESDNERLVRDEGKCVMLEVHCQEIDRMSNDFGGTEYSVEFSDDLLSVTLSAVYDRVVIEYGESDMCNLIRYANETRIEATEDGKILISFTFNSMWDNANMN